MSRASSFTRQLLLIRKIQQENAKGVFPTLEALMNDVTKNLFNRNLDEVGISEITFKRDLQQIRKFFCIPIFYDKKEKGYYIEDYPQNESIIETALESFEILSSLNNDGVMPDFIIPEKRKSTGTQYFSNLMACIKNEDIVSFAYFKYDTEITTHPVIYPYALKESQRRWYLIGKTTCTNEIRAYGLDRISNINRTGLKFKKTTTTTEIIKKYEDCFAMFSSDANPEKIIISYDKRDGNYIKSFPVHHSQLTEKEEENRIFFSFYLKIEPDFMMELLSRAWSLEIIEPLSLRTELHKILTDAKFRNS